MTFLQITSALIVLAGTFAAINAIFFRLPSAIGILIVSLLASLALLGLDALWPSLHLTAELQRMVVAFDFSVLYLKRCWACFCLPVPCM